MKSIDLNIRSGITVPIGTKSDNNYPSSVSFMGNGHWSFYFDTITELELKQDWKFGFLVSAIYQFRNSRKLRIPVYKEPAVFSALVADVQIDPGMTFKLSPYIIAANLTDGINFLLRYSYLRHNKNKWKDKRKDPNIKSYLSQIERLMSGEQITSIDIEKNIQEKKDLSKWRAHYFSLEVNYDSNEAGNDWVLDPIVYLNYDYQFSGNGSCKTIPIFFLSHFLSISLSSTESIFIRIFRFHLDGLGNRCRAADPGTIRPVVIP
jgi:hypothetical protein